jgi:TrmH family RNA methyltransferase
MHHTTITSRQNALIKGLRHLRDKARYRRAEGLTIAEGERIVRDLIETGGPVRQLLLAEAAYLRDDVRPWADAAAGRGIETHVLSTSCYDAFTSLKSPDGIAAVATWQPAPLESVATANARLAVLSCVQDPGNAGGIVRTAAAAGASAVVFAGGGVDPRHPALVRGSAGMSLRLPIAVAGDAEFVNQAQQAGIRLLAASGSAEVCYTEADYGAPMALLIGSEGQGVSSALLDGAHARLQIPMANDVESLNAGVAAALLLYEARKYWEV